MNNAALESSGVIVNADYRDDGSIVLSNGLSLPDVSGTIPGRLRHWALETPDAPFLSQGDRTLSYGEAERMRRFLAARLLGLPLRAKHPLMIVADNGIDHALLMLAATSIGIPVAIVSTTYVAPGARPWAKFGRIVEQIDPAIIVADKPELVRDALSGSAADLPVHLMGGNAWLSERPGQSDAQVDAAEASVGLDTVAKLLFTSGSTGHPKAVPNTQRMMVSNMLGLSVVWPFLSHRPPVSADWLPWNHTFGGNCCFNITLWFGGHSQVDSGRPAPALIGSSVEAIRKCRPTIYYNVPAGFEAILPHLEADEEFAATFLSNLEFIFNAGAAMPTVLRSRLEALALRTTGRAPHIVGGWGSTETAPFSTVLYFDQPHANNLGAPLPGTQVKMVPSEGRFELRVKGPNVMPGYWNDSDATAKAFDDEHFYRIGDAAVFADSDNPSAGILFDGRVAENFKLTSGTWVNVGALRLAIVSASEKLISDAVIAGEGRADIRLLIFPNEAACKAVVGDADEGGGQPVACHPAIRSRIARLLRAHNERQTGSSTRIAQFEILDEPPSATDDEITDKGYLNQRRVLARRAKFVERLYLREAGLADDL